MTRRAGLDTAIVVQAAADLVNSEGIEALSLGKLAVRLGVRTPSLYNHVDGLPGLQRALTLLNVRTLGDCLDNAVLGKAGAAAVMALAQAYRAYIKECPGLYTISLRAAGTQTPGDPDLLAAEDRVVRIALAAVAAFGLHGADALHAVRGLRSVVHGFATLEVAGGFGLPLDCDESFRRLVMLLIGGLHAMSNGENV